MIPALKILASRYSALMIRNFETSMVYGKARFLHTIEQVERREKTMKQTEHEISWRALSHQSISRDRYAAASYWAYICSLSA